MLPILALLLACGDSTDPNDSGVPDKEDPKDTDTPKDTDSTDAPSCETYCMQMHDVCPEEAFHKDGACEVWCASTVAPVPVGALTDTDVDTLGCRMNYIAQAEAATNETEREQFCANASASGGDTCGSWCDVYCRQGVATCSGANDDYPMSASTYFDEDPNSDPMDVCEAACPTFPTDVLDGVSQVDQHFGYGDTVQCRLHHQQAAIIEGVTDNANAFALHCGHGAIEPTELCEDQARPNTVNYCEFALHFCPDLFPDGADALECRGTLNTLVDQGSYVEGPFLSFIDTNINSLGCLNYWIMAAPTDPTACAKADWDPDHWVIAGGEGVCVPPPPP